MKMELNGFKSFGDKVKINFSIEGITTFIGPNGCGKSNIVDALKWVLGEQSVKSLRGKSMQDVIFVGTNKRAAASFCEVQLTFLNASSKSKPQFEDYPEIVVARRIYQDGGSEYLLNDKICRLADIKDLFVDTGLGLSNGYSIIEQDSIGRLTTSKPLELKWIIEEAAGVVKFKLKRQESEKKLLEAKQNLVRISDILEGLKIQESDLGAQVKEAKIHHNLSAQVERSENLINAGQWYNYSQKIKALETELQQISFDLELVNNQFTAEDTKLSSKKAELELLEKDLEDLRSKLESTNSKKQSLASDIKLKEQQKLDLEKWQKKGKTDNLKYKSALVEVEVKLEEAHKDLKKHSENQDKLKKAENLIYEEIKSLNSEINAWQIELAEKMKIGRELYSKQSELVLAQNSSAIHINNLSKQVSAAEEEVAAVEQDISSSNNDLHVLNTNIISLNEKFNNLSLDLSKKDQNLKDVKQEIANQNQYLTEHNSLLGNIKSQIIKCETQIDLLEEGQKNILSFAQKARTDKVFAKNLGFVEVLSELVDAKKVLNLAWLRKFDNYTNLVIFSSIDKLNFILEQCKSFKLDHFKFTFLDLEKSSLISQNWPDGLEVSLNATNRFLNQIFKAELNIFQSAGNKNEVENTKSKSGSLLSQIFNSGEVLKNDELQSSAKITNVDLTSSLVQGVESEFIYYDSENQSLYQKKQHYVSQLKKLLHNKQQAEINLNQKLESIDSLTKQVKNEELTKTKLKDELSEIKIDQEVSVNKVNILKAKISGQENQKKQKLQQIKFAQAELDKNSSSSAEYKQNLELFQQKIEEVSEQKRKYNQKLEEAKSAKETSHKNLHQAKIAVNNSDNEIKMLGQLQLMLGKEKQKIHLALSSTSLNENQDETALAKNIEQTKELENQLLNIEGEIKNVSLYLLGKRESYNAQKQLISEFEKSLKDHLVQLKRKEAEKQIMQSQIDQARQNRISVENELFEFKKLKPEEILRTFDISDFDEKNEYKKLKNAKLELASMKFVNFSAESEYAKIFEKLSFLENQYKDLTGSIEILEESIKKINIASETLFKEAFAVINQKFKSVFVQLFGGGDASLILLDEDNILESGIDIKVCPPNKVMKNMHLLSGGEKALTAVALVVAIFLYKPSPFCVLDEVDAPLDVSNIKRFCELIKSLTPRSQFIMITHNPNSMEVADYLYGITMEESGVSKAVSVDLKNLASGKKLLAVQNS